MANFCQPVPSTVLWFKVSFIIPFRCDRMLSKYPTTKHCSDFSGPNYHPKQLRIRINYFWPNMLLSALSACVNPWLRITTKTSGCPLHSAQLPVCPHSMCFMNQIKCDPVCLCSCHCVCSKSLSSPAKFYLQSHYVSNRIQHTLCQPHCGIYLACEYPAFLIQRIAVSLGKKPII